MYSSSQVIFTWQQCFLISFPYSGKCLTFSPQGPESTSWDWWMYRYCSLGIACVSSLLSGQLVTMLNQCEGIADSLRLLIRKKKITGNNWDAATCGSLWGVESNPRCPELWIPEVRLELVIRHGVCIEENNETICWASCFPQVGVTESLSAKKFELTSRLWSGRLKGAAALANGKQGLC